MSKIARIVQIVCHRLQLQEKIGADILEVIQLATNAEDVKVEITAKHSCVTARGIKERDAETKTVIATGAYNGKTAFGQAVDITLSSSPCTFQQGERLFGGEKTGKSIEVGITMDKSEKQEISQIRVVKKKPTDAEIVEALLASGGVVTAAVAWLAKNKHIKAERSTIAKRIQRTPALEEARQEATEMMLDVAENRLMSLLNGGDRAAIFFFLKCKGKGRGYIERQEYAVTPTEKESPYKELTMDELKKIAGEE